MGDKPWKSQMRKQWNALRSYFSICIVLHACMCRQKRYFYPFCILLTFKLVQKYDFGDSNQLFWFGSCTGFIFLFSLMKVRERFSRIHCKRKGKFHSTVIGWAVDWRMSESRLESVGGSQESMKWIEDPLESNFPTTFKRIFREKDKMSMASTSTGDAKPGGYDKDIYLDDG